MGLISHLTFLSCIILKGPVVRGYFPIYLVNFHLNWKNHWALIYGVILTKIAILSGKQLKNMLWNFRSLNMCRSPTVAAPVKKRLKKA